MDFDILYMVKTPFFMGSSDSAISDLSLVEVDSEDEANLLLKKFYEMRILFH